MTCSDWQKEIAAGETGSVENHLAGCAECRRFADDLDSARNWWTMAAASEDIDTRRVHARVMSEVRQPRSKWLWLWAPAVALAAVVCAVWINLRQTEIALPPSGHPMIAAAPAAPKTIEPSSAVQTAARRHRPAPRPHTSDIGKILIQTDDPQVVILLVGGDD